MSTRAAESYVLNAMSYLNGEAEVDTDAERMSIALDILNDAYAELESGHECWNGVLWPIRTDDNGDHDWIERCDECHIYPDDEAAALALSKRVGVAASMVVHPTLNRFAPYIDLDGR